MPLNLRVCCVAITVTGLMDAATWTRFSEPCAGAEIDTRPIQLVTQPAFGGRRFDRPVVITNFGDGSKRLVIGLQRGRIVTMDPSKKKPTPFLDIRDTTVYKDEQNEEGLLGIAFHPNYQQNRTLFIYYTRKGPERTSVISSFRVPEGSEVADPKTEEEILRIPQPFWNHNGGTIAFGPDGYLYVAMGDGGLGNDPHMNGQNVQSLLGAILRIDVDRRGEEGQRYAIPADNPFISAGKLARPEIWAYGFRNVWRMSFDRQTGLCWAADVGQKLYEEINIVKGGGNYGWNLREATHPFGPVGSGPRPDLIDPIWEYDHSIGKSITGGFVYHGQKYPELRGGYLYADYVSGKMWALWYDHEQRRVTANRPIENGERPIMTFGEAEQGEAYLGDAFGFVCELVPQ